MKRTTFPLLALSFGVTLAIIVGQRMSIDAMAVVIGVAVGVCASVPTSLLLVALLRRERSNFRRYDEPPPAMPPQLQQPNFIILDPAQFGQFNRQQLGQPLAPLTPATDAGLRRLRVLGHDSQSQDW